MVGGRRRVPLPSCDFGSGQRLHRGSKVDSCLMFVRSESDDVEEGRVGFSNRREALVVF